MNTNEPWTELERRRAEWVALLFRDQVGLDVDHSELNRRAQAMNKIAETLAPSYRQEPDAWSLLSRMMALARLTPLLLETRRLAEQHLTFKDILVDGQPVTPYSWPRYLRQEDDPERRRQLLSRITKGHPELDDAWERHRAMQSELAAQWGHTPLDDFLAAEGLSLEQLRRLLLEMAAALRPAFESRFAECRAAALGAKQGERWEDFVTLYMNRWSVLIDQQLPALNSVETVRRLVRTMGFAVETIFMDLEDRPRKTPGASTWTVRVPDDVRLSVKPVGSAGDLLVLYHAMGNALHFSSVDPALAFPLRANISYGHTETFSFWLQSLLDDAVYVEELGLNDGQATEMIRFSKLVVVTFATWLSAQALCVVDYWTEGPFSLEQLGERLSSYMERFMGLSAPPEAIRTLPNLVRLLNLNVVGFPVAYARLGHLLEQLEAERRDWWRSPDAVDLVRGYMRRGRHAHFPPSMVGIAPFVARYGS